MEDGLLKTGRLSKNLPTKWRVPQPLYLLAFKTRVARIVAHGQKTRVFFFEKKNKDSKKSSTDPDLLGLPIKRLAYHLIPLKESLSLVYLLICFMYNILLLDLFFQLGVTRYLRKTPSL